MLVHAYAAMSAIEKQASAAGLNDEQRARVLSQTRQNIANSIEQGQYPDIKIRQNSDITQERVPER